MNSPCAGSTLPPLSRNSILRQQWMLFTACPEHLSARTCAHYQRTPTTVPTKQFLLQWCLQGLVLITAGVFKSNGEFGCLRVFFPSLQKNPTFQILDVCYWKKRKIMLLKTKSLFKVFRVHSGDLLQWVRASLLTSSARLLFSPFFHALESGY